MCWNDFVRVDFSWADLSRGRPSCGDVLIRCHSAGADLSGADLRRSDFTQCDFTDAKDGGRQAHGVAGWAGGWARDEHRRSGAASCVGRTMRDRSPLVDERSRRTSGCS